MIWDDEEIRLIERDFVIQSIIEFMKIHEISFSEIAECLRVKIAHPVNCEITEVESSFLFKFSLD